MAMEPDWGDLRIFLAVATTGTYAKAAQRCRLSLATVGRRIDALEQALGIRLFERLPNGHRLTEAGQALAPAAGRMAIAAEDFLRAAALSRSTDTPNVRLWGQEWEVSFIASHLPVLHGGLDGSATLELLTSHQAPKLARREAEILLSCTLPSGGEMKTRRLGHMAFAVYGTQEFVAANPAALTESRYRDCDWVGFNAEHGYFDMAVWLDEQRGGLPPQQRCSNGNVLLEAVRAGAGLSPLPCWLGDADPRLVRVSTVLPDLAREVWWLIHPDLQDWPPMQRVLDQLVILFRDQGPALAGTRNSVQAFVAAASSRDNA